MLIVVINKDNLRMGASSMQKVKKIPCGISPEDRIERARIFNNMDVNGNGFLSLAEIDKGIRDVLDLPELFQTKPVIMRAYQTSKIKCQGEKNIADDLVTKAEFRYLLISLKMYYHLWLQFEELDTSKDRRIGERQFVLGKDKIAKWGIKVADPKKTFQEILKMSDANQFVTFTQFCEWAIAEHLKHHPNSKNHQRLD